MGFKRKFIFLLLALVLAHLMINAYSISKTNIIEKLSGEIYYLKRDDLNKNLYKTTYNPHSTEMIYSHAVTKEKNKNIINFHYNPKNNLIHFEAMKDSKWATFTIKEGEKQPKFIGFIKEQKLSDIDYQKSYISTNFRNMSLVNERGSLFLVKENKKILLKKFFGVYDGKFNPGYIPIGFSPNGKYVIYKSNGRLTPIGALLEHFLTDDVTEAYIMELESKDINRFINGYGYQWITKGSK